MSERQLIAANFAEGRNTLLRDIDGLSVDEHDWLVRPGVMTIGSQLLYIAGFNDLVVSAYEGQDLSQKLTSPLWQDHYRHGFPRELDVPTPAGLDIGYYLELLHAETIRTQELLDGSTDFAEVTPLFYADGQEFQAAGLRPYALPELFNNIPLHDRYHRGQVTLLKWMAKSKMNGE